MRFFAVALIFFGVAASYAQTPEVPHKMYFADMTLTIRDDARREIQNDVDALTKSPRYFNVKVERAKTYFPIIEKILEEERVPLDFKYLVLQESALIADAVSVSNAVGFWQFKDFTALEMGMRVDKEIDERMNIYSSTRGAARYLKKNNYLFNNWLMALQSYQMGGGGVQRSVGDKYNGDRHMEITSETYWYVKKYLAHKVAFEEVVKGDPQVKVITYPVSVSKGIKDLSNELVVEEATLREYNKWIKGNTIPADRAYAVVIPSGKQPDDFNTLLISSTNDSKPAASRAAKPVKKTINGVPALQAQAGETASGFSSRAGISLSEFLRYNEMTVDAQITPGAFYFLKKKKARAEVASHRAQVGEDLWIISQHYGVRLKQLRKYNPDKVQPGSEVWFVAHETTSALVPAMETVSVAEVESGEFFSWSVTPENSQKQFAALVAVQNNVEVTPQPQSVERMVRPPRDTVHRVLVKETLYSIAKMYGVSVTDLVEWNSLDLTAGIKVNQELKIKAQTPEEVSSTPRALIHEVKGTDTLYSVARQYNVTIKELMDWNRKEDFTLSLGEKLTIWPH